MQNKRIQYIKYLMLFINIAAVLFISVFIYITTQRVCTNFIAGEFLETLRAIPWEPDRIVIGSVIMMLILAASFVVREYLFPERKWVRYGSLLLDCVVSMLLVIHLDFNYNAILFWVFANVISHIKGRKGQFVFVLLAVVSFIGTDYELASIGSQRYAIGDYIGYYEATAQPYFQGMYNVLVSVNIIVFIAFCIYVIQEQRGTIDEVNMLYEKLSVANEELKEYADIKEKMGETRERNRLAREIHDTLGHTLTGISAGLDACIATIDITPQLTKKQLEVISDVTRDGIKEIRRSVSELRPDALERQSLRNAIDKMVKDMNLVSGIKVHFNSEIEKLNFDEDEENAIYRVVQESLTNAVRHGRATEIFIEIKREHMDVHLTIRDNGVGCKEMKKGFGTRHIVERVEMLNGTVTFDGSNGFVTEVLIPIRWGEDYD